MKNAAFAVCAGALFATLSGSFAGNLCSDGIAFAVPVKDGAAPVIDGRLDDWDLSGEEPCWNAEAYADSEYAKLAFMYDEDFLYASVRMGLKGREYRNPNRPGDRFWYGDCVQIRVCADPALPRPVPRVQTDAIAAINIWKNTLDGEDHLFITAGPDWNRVMEDRPAGSAVKIAVAPGACTMEARIPWKALGVPSGKMPFAPGGDMSACIDVKWFPGSDGHYTSLVFDRDPGAFAFLNLDTWGRIRFSPRGGLDRKRKTLEEIASAARAAEAAPVRASTEIRLDLPKPGKLSVNIVRDDGWIVRELAGGEKREAGANSVFWDGRDALGNPCETGRRYAWKAYLHDGLDWEYIGTVGVSGEPPYETADGRGGWGSDHGPLVDCAADSSGRYFLWHVAESGRAVVKTDFDGKVVWRVSPFVAGGFCPFNAIAADGGKLYIVLEQGAPGRRETQLVRLDAATGNYELFPDGKGSVPVPASNEKLDLPVRGPFALNAAGIAVSGGEVYVSDTMGDRVFVLNRETAQVLRTIPLTRPRGLCAHGGSVFAALAGGSVVEMRKDGSRATAVAEGLELPQGVAVAEDGRRMYVSDLGGSHQIKEFVLENGLWKPGRTFGRKGGRSPCGKLDLSGFLYPAGLAVDKTGTLLAAEMAPPKIAHLIDLASGETVRRYFGYTSYSPTTFPDAEDPRTIYYSLAGPDAFARARLPESGGAGLPEACWDFEAEGSPFGSIVSTMNTPYVLKASNGRKYIVPDAGPGMDCGGYGPDYKARYGTWGRPLARIDEGDAITPVACVWNTGKEGDALLVWCDRDGDGKVGAGEMAPLTGAGGRVFRWALQNGSMYIDRNGDCYLTTQNGCIVRLVNRGWNAAGAPDWDVASPEIAIPEMLPGVRFGSGWRYGFLGMRRAATGEFYAAVNCNVEYATPELSKYMHRGMGHTADMNAVYILKYDASGRLVWRAGRKATGAAKPGEILHHWCFAGLVGDDYAVAASEWGCFTFYTADGFYVDRIFDTPGLDPSGKAGPAGLGGEDFSGQVVWFPERDEVWAYNSGHAFKVLGFENGRVKGEWRAEGSVLLETVDPLEFAGAAKPICDVVFEPGDDMVTFSAHVEDSTPLENAASSAVSVFKGGDAVGFETGPADEAEGLDELPERNPSARRLGFARVLAARIGGRDTVVGFKPFTDGEKRPFSYSTPAGGESAFEFAGEIPGATVEFAVDADGKGYTATIRVPRAFFELDFSKGCAFEAEALFSGAGARGKGTVRRCYLHGPATSGATMTDDTPTESRLRPSGWRRLQL